MLYLSNTADLPDIDLNNHLFLLLSSLVTMSLTNQFSHKYQVSLIIDVTGNLQQLTQNTSEMHKKEFNKKYWINSPFKANQFCFQNTRLY